jgi:hypothetical protein
MTTPADPAEPIEYELRATLEDGSRLIVGPFATLREASERAHALLGVDVVWVETLRRVSGRVQLLGVIGRPKPPERGEDDPLRPRRNNGGVIW